MPAGFSSIPQVFACEDYAGHRLLLESALAGQGMSPALVRRQPEASAEAGVAWLLHLHEAMADRNGDSEESYKRLIERPIIQFEKAFPLSPEEEQLLHQTRRLAGRLRTRSLPLVLEPWRPEFPQHPALRERCRGFGLGVG